MNERPDAVETWRDVSAAAARATGYRPATAPAAPRWSGLASIGAMTVALVLIVAGLALRPAPGPGSDGPVTAQADDGMFRLKLTTARGTYGPGYPIAPVASLTYLGPDGTVSVQHTTSPVQFRIEEIGGSRIMADGSRDICASTNLTKDTALDVPFEKAGSPTDDASAGFDRTWYQDRTLTLPVGTWRISASIDLGIGGCTPTHHLSVSNVIDVVAPTGDGPVVDLADDGVFSLELTAPRRTYAPADAIEPVATVRYLGPAAEARIYHAGSIVGWVIEEVGGTRTMSGAMTMPCIPDIIRKDTPLGFPFAKSGGIGETFDRAWFDDPVLHLPVGTWRIRGYTTIAADDGPAPSDGSFTCGTRGHGQSVAIVVTVVGDAAPSAETSPTPETAPSPTTPSPLPSFSADPVVGSGDDGTFHLVLSTPHGIYESGGAIDPMAALTFIGPGSEITFGYGDPAVSFTIDEVGGDRRMVGGSSEVCSVITLTHKPFIVGFAKGSETVNGFDQAWLQDPVLRLPAGTWRISATLHAYVPDCGLVGIHTVTAENVIEVVDPSVSGAGDDDADAALAIATLYETARATGREDACKVMSTWSLALYGSCKAYQRVQADLNAGGHAQFQIDAPTRSPELLNAAIVGDRAADLAANADPARTYLVTIHYPNVFGTPVNTLNLIVAVQRGSSSNWQVWVDDSAAGR